MALIQRQLAGTPGALQMSEVPPSLSRPVFKTPKQGCGPAGQSPVPGAFIVPSQYLSVACGVTMEKLSVWRMEKTTSVGAEMEDCESPPAGVMSSARPERLTLSTSVKPNPPGVVALAAGKVLSTRKFVMPFKAGSSSLPTLSRETSFKR